MLLIAALRSNKNCQITTKTIQFNLTTFLLKDCYMLLIAALRSNKNCQITIKTKTENDKERGQVNN
jgi:hypothetical protein